MSTATVDATIDDLRDALNACDSAMALAVTMNLVAVVSVSADARLIAQTRARIDRLRTTQSVPEVDAATLSQAVVALGLSLTRLRISAAAERSSREGGELAHEIRAALAVPARPKDLIERTGADPAQVARVLRKLEDADEVERVASPVGDGRERWYRLRSDCAVAVFTAPQTPPPDFSRSASQRRRVR